MVGSFAEKTAPLMEALSGIFQSFPRLALYYTTVVRFVFVVLAVFIVGRAVVSLLRAKTPPEIWGYLSLPGSHFVPILHWENVVGRDKSVDLHVDIMTVSRNHGTLVRNSRGDWYYSDLNSKSGSAVNGKPVNGPTLVRMGDTLTLGGVDCTLMPPSLAEKQRNVAMRKKHSTAAHLYSAHRCQRRRAAFYGDPGLPAVRPLHVGLLRVHARAGAGVL